ncbi:MAG: hypothetical protein Q8P98_02350, partial [Candidatus Rokubacteria bacterium]|nr:hypothetical protein [Candidatus Rokubacteria bacterium]
MSTRSYSPEATASAALRTASMPVAQYAATRVTGIVRFTASKIMSERLWWKFSPNLMVPVPMMAT